MAIVQSQNRMRRFDDELVHRISEYHPGTDATKFQFQPLDFLAVDQLEYAREIQPQAVILSMMALLEDRFHQIIGE